MFMVKLAAALSLVGGVSRGGQGSPHVRGDIHLLMIGDPGIGGWLPESRTVQLPDRCLESCVPESDVSGGAAGVCTYLAVIRLPCHIVRGPRSGTAGAPVAC